MINDIFIKYLNKQIEEVSFRLDTADDAYSENELMGRLAALGMIKHDYLKMQAQLYLDFVTRKSIKT